MISEIEQQRLDINWFFTNGEYVGFVASGGGKLPYSVAQSKETLENLNEYFCKLGLCTEYVINTYLNKNYLSDKQYIAAFAHFTNRGLYAYDRTVLNNFSAVDHHLVCQPITPIKLADLPLEIVDVLSKVAIVGEMPLTFNLVELGFI